MKKATNIIGWTLSILGIAIYIAIYAEEIGYVLTKIGRWINEKIGIPPLISLED